MLLVNLPDLIKIHQHGLKQIDSQFGVPVHKIYFLKKGFDIIKKERMLTMMALMIIVLFGIVYWFNVDKKKEVIFSKEELIKAYEKMQAGPDGINGYILELRIFGQIDNERINETVRLKNYMNEQLEVKINNISKEKGKGRVNEAGEANEISEEISNENVFVVSENKVYKQNKDAEYVEYKEEFLYKDVNIYLKGLNNIIEIKETEIETMGVDEYSVYHALVDLNAVQEILDSLNIEYEVLTNVETKIYLDKEGYVYRIMYDLGNIKIYAYYVAINQVTESVISINN